MTPSVTLGPVLPHDWSLSEVVTGTLHGFDNTNVMLWRLGGPDKDQVVI